MLSAPRRKEIDHRTIKLIVGLIALTLAALTSTFAAHRITSISASYYESGWSQAIFIGFLFAIAAFLVAYNGLTVLEMIFSKIASGAALGVALFPCGCDGRSVPVPYVHGVSAAVMFLILAYFCHCFYQRAMEKGYPQAKFRAGVYAACGAAIVTSIVVLGLDQLLKGAWARQIPRLVFYGEAVGLVAFGISWLTASRTIPLITRSDERFSPLRESNPPS